MNAEFKKKLAIPMEVKEACPLSAHLADIVTRRDVELKKIFSGEDDRLILIIGPCSADNKDSVIDYISRLAKLNEKVSEKIFFVPRIYTNKPRTTGDGYKGLLHQPDPTEKPDMYKGILATRGLHIAALQETGFSCADEMLYPSNYEYLDDVLAYVAVGARSVENQEHRLTSSAIGVPVGMKNPTSGDMSVMMNAITAAQHSHTFIYRGWEVNSQGNPYAHAILRGFSNHHGESQPNYHYENLTRLVDLYQHSPALTNPAAIIDTNHSNSGKKPLEQPRIIKEVLYSMRHNPDIKKLVKGFMVQSYIEDGAQKIGEGCYGKSITDPCIGWDKTERLILDIAEML